MAQHDLLIDNASGAAVRADINAALAALGSTMKGATAPPAPVAGMLWVEDDNPTSARWTLRVYDGAGWITVGVIDSTTDVFEPASTAVGLSLIRAADAAAVRTAAGATATGSSLLTAADAAAARTAVGATTTGSAVLTAANAAAARTAIGATATGDALIIAADAAAGRAAINAAIVPTTSAGVGQVTLINPGSGNSAVLPSGGTWWWFFMTFNVSTGANSFTQNVGISAGGATIVAGTAGLAFIGFAWRIT